MKNYGKTSSSWKRIFREKKYFMEKMQYYLKKEYLMLSVKYLNKVGKATISNDRLSYLVRLCDYSVFDAKLLSNFEGNFSWCLSNMLRKVSAIFT